MFSFLCFLKWKDEMDENDQWTGVLKTGLVFGESQHPISMRSAMD